MDTKIKVLRDELGIPVQTIAREMGVSRQTIYKILDGQSWTKENEARLATYLIKVRKLLEKV